MTKIFGRSLIKRWYSNKRPLWRLLFFGNDKFSLYSLKSVFQEFVQGSLFGKLEVVTSSSTNPVYNFSQKHNLPVHQWPLKLEDSDFDLGLVVSFGHLIPNEIIKQFPFGILNVHASLLPRWRGAAPITYALANGDPETGVTVMRIKPHKFDVGDILYQERLSIGPDTELPELHEKLGLLGAESVLDTIRNLEERLRICQPQPEEGATYAPKLTPDFARIRWQIMEAKDIYNLQRALKGLMVPKAHWNDVTVRLLDIRIRDDSRRAETPGLVRFDWKLRELAIECAQYTWIGVKRVQIEGKKPMSASDFQNGFLSKLPKGQVPCFS